MEKKITVTTSKTGYHLTVEYGNKKVEYLYYTPALLVEGMQYHIGRNEPSYLDVEAIAPAIADSLIKERQAKANQKLEERILNDKIMPCNLRLTYRVESYVRGKNAADCKRKFEGIDLFTTEAKERFGTSFVELISSEEQDD